MNWKSKTDVIAISVLIGGFTLISVVVSLIGPIIYNVRHGDIWAIWPILVLAFLISCLILLIGPKKEER